MRFVLIAAVLALLSNGVVAEEDHPVVKQDVSIKKHTVKKPAVASPIETPKLDLLGVERNIIAKTNAERRRNGLPALAMDESLMRSARSHCTWMASNRSLQHTRAVVAENIAMGQSSSTEAVRDWMNSPGHRANILAGSYTRIGVAAYRARDGQVYWCQQFIQ